MVQLGTTQGPREAIDRCLTGLLESDKQWLSACQTPGVVGF